MLGRREIVNAIPDRRQCRLVRFACICEAMAFLFAFGALVWGTEPMQPPVLLVHGFQPLPGFVPTELWEAMAELLSGSQIQHSKASVLDKEHTFFHLPALDLDHRHVFISGYAFDHEPTIHDIRFYSARLADEIAWITNALECEQVDVVAFSMGGLIARAYIEAEDFTEVLGDAAFPDYGVAYRGNVRMLVTLATPHHGITYATFGEWLGPAVRQMVPGSPFLTFLNQRTSAGETSSHLHSNIIYVTFAGQSCLGCTIRRDEETCLRDCAEEGKSWQGSDGVVLMESARLIGAENHACISIEHTAMRDHAAICESVTAVLDDRFVPEIIYTASEFRFDEPML